MRRTRAVIVDDEALARERIRTLLHHRDDVDVVAEAADGRAAVSTLVQHAPDLVFLDVQMPEMDGFEVLDQLRDGEVPHVIFVTAHDAYAIRAFDVHALDYLLKPFDRERFDEAVDRAVRSCRDDGPDRRTNIQELLDEARGRSTPALRRFVVREGDRIRFVLPDDVEWIGAEGNYVSLNLAGKSHLIRGTMKALEEVLDASRFVRVHRSAIVNLDRVREVRPWFNGDFRVVMGSGREITTGETYRSRVQELLRNPL